MIGALADEFPGSQQDARRIRRQRIYFLNQTGTLLLGHAAVQDEWPGNGPVQRCLDGDKGCGTFG